MKSLQCGRCCLAAESRPWSIETVACPASMWPLLLSSGKALSTDEDFYRFSASMWPLLLSSGKPE